MSFGHETGKCVLSIPRDMDPVRGTYLVTHSDREDEQGDTSTVLQDVETGQIHPITGQSFPAGEIIEATLVPEPPLEVTWTVDTIDRQYAIEITVLDEGPDDHARTIAADTTTGQLHREPLDGGGELHILPVPAEQRAAAIEDIRTDDETRARAARIGATRVEIRAGEEFLSVRYLP